MQCKICQKELISKANNAMYCSQKCKSRAKYIKQRLKLNNNCIICQKPTSNPKFCSHKCSAKVNYKTTTKPTLCRGCGAQIADHWTQRKKCDDCKAKRKSSFDINLTLKQLKVKVPNINQFHAKIRGLARSYFKSTGQCSKCGYNKHTNVCHIKPVKDFDDMSLVSDVNSISNLIELCPNCHWEFDHLVAKEEIESSPEVL